jgi:hypothetical protein
MARNTSKGVLQVSTLTITEMNLVLQEISARLDALEGLRGPVVVNDALLVSKRLEAQTETAPSPSIPVHGFGSPEDG